MSETATVNKKGILVNPDRLNGKWKLIYNIENALGPDGFGGQLLEPYQDPFTRKTIYPMDENNNFMQIGFYVDKLTSYFFPDQLDNNGHFNAIIYMLGHPNVGIENVELNKTFAKSKLDNPKFKLMNMDYAKEVEIDSQEIIDRVIGLLSLDSGVRALNTNKLQYVLAKLNEPFIDKRYIGNPGKLKIAYRTKVKDYVRKGIKNANTVQTILDNLDDAKRSYLVKYLISLDKLQFSAGSYRFEGRAIGHSDTAVIVFIEQHPEIQGRFEEILSDHLKEEEEN